GRSNECDAPIGDGDDAVRDGGRVHAVLDLARWVVPITAPPIANGVVAVANGRIAFVGSADRGPAGDDVDLGEVLLLPGLVNAHCHLELTAMRGFLEDIDFRRWILRLTNAR